MQRLLDIKRTQIQMVQDRGYNVDAELPVLDYDIAAFQQHVEGIQRQLVTPGGPRPTVRSALSRIYVTPDRTQQMLVYYGAPTEGKELPVVVVRDFIRILRGGNIRNGILIGEANASFAGRTEIDAYIAETGTAIQIFKESELTYNPTHHIDVPRHELISREEATALLRAMKTDRSHMLVIRAKDPIIRYYNWPVGQIVRIYRTDAAVSVVAPRSVNYRVIIP